MKNIIASIIVMIQIIEGICLLLFRYSRADLKRFNIPLSFMKV